ncbi:MAG: DUF58 domain-containing protein [Butyrivibrio sp.]|nr:DUF58 domain-containing protein [Butyrivibrio sp.]
MIRPDYDYLERIRRTFALEAHHRTTNILDGDYVSVYRGKSLDFDDLKEYTPGDDVRDIDWRASSRTGRTLVRRYVSDRKISALFVLDAGAHMQADTSAGEAKDELALLTFGSLAYLLMRQGADVAATFLTDAAGRETFSMFRSGPEHLERLLVEYGRAVCGSGGETIAAQTARYNGLLERVQDVARRRMVIFVITDTEGIAALDERVLGHLSETNDVFLLHLEDAFYTGDHVFDTRRGRYVPGFLSRSAALHRAELAERAQILERVGTMVRHDRMGFVTLTGQEEVVPRVMAMMNGMSRQERMDQWISLPQ